MQGCLLKGTANRHSIYMLGNLRVRTLAVVKDTRQTDITQGGKNRQCKDLGKLVKHGHKVKEQSKVKSSNKKAENMNLAM